MFEIGSSLREARLRQGIDLVDAEQATKIRTKYLKALEDERFELLPAQTYVKGFLRSYAEFLNLDGQIYVDEYNSRFYTGDDEAAFRRRPRRAPAAHRRVESSVLLVALAGIAAATALVIVAWKWGGDDPNRIPGLGPASTTTSTTQTRGSGAKAPAVPPAKTPWVALVLTAKKGNTWLAARRGGPTGRLLFSGTLERGRSQRFVGAQLWLNVGSPANVAAKLDGRRVAVPGPRTRPAVIVASARGLERASAG
jgi:cytoskeleton protein RodZ